MFIAVGLDSIELDLVKKFCATGHLPFINKVIHSGLFQELVSNTEVSSGSTWATLNTGLNPGKHGFTFSHRQFKSGTYDVVKMDADTNNPKYFWEYLPSHFQKAVVDLPYTKLCKSPNLTHLVSWGVESKNHISSSQPAELIEQIHQKHGKHPLIDWYHVKPRNIEELQQLVDITNDALEKRKKIVLDQLNSKDWDFFYFAINEFHWLGHYVCHMLNDKHPEYDKNNAPHFENEVLKIYKNIDGFLNEISKLYPEAKLIFFANTGVDANLSGRHLLLDILQAAGFSPKPKKSLSPAAKWGSLASLKIENLIGGRNIAIIKKFFPQTFWHNITRKVLNMGNTWSQSRAFEIPGDYAGAIRINLIDREPRGMVKKGEEYDEICQQIADIFLGLKHTQSGKPVVKEVVKTKDKYYGSLLDKLMDLSIIWADEEPIIDITSPTLGRFTGKLEDKRTGAHNDHAFIGFHNIKAKLNSKNIGHTQDIAPTIFALLNIDIPKEFDGRSLIQE